MTRHAAARILLGPAVPAALVACTSDEGGTPPPSSSTSSPTAQPDVTEVVGDLDVPWDSAFLPDGAALVTLRDRGEVVRVEDGAVSSVGSVPGVVAEGEGGLPGSRGLPHLRAGPDRLRLRDHGQ
uniref:PQQ-dependent sugar dehydrogenase n=1 Tax=Janibacter limosus TaxID=53458 RepID=A0AC61U760_9MICO|nr:PQQ-dependent sugar dehydrogenase [Janibacter limosus]